MTIMSLPAGTGKRLISAFHFQMEGANKFFYYDSHYCTRYRFRLYNTRVPSSCTTCIRMDHITSFYSSCLDLREIN